jgi:hypothetical protein
MVKSFKKNVRPNFFGLSHMLGPNACGSKKVLNPNTCGSDKIPDSTFLGLAMHSALMLCF